MFSFNSLRASTIHSSWPPFKIISSILSEVINVNEGYDYLFFQYAHDIMFFFV